MNKEQAVHAFLCAITECDISLSHLNNSLIKSLDCQAPPRITNVRAIPPLLGVTVECDGLDVDISLSHLFGHLDAKKIYKKFLHSTQFCNTTIKIKDEENTIFKVLKANEKIYEYFIQSFLAFLEPHINNGYSNISLVLVEDITVDGNNIKVHTTINGALIQANLSHIIGVNYFEQVKEQLDV